jgi:hypothetical protein
MKPELVNRIKARKEARGTLSGEHSVAVNFDDPAEPVMYEPASGAIHRGFEHVLSGLSAIFDAQPECIKWRQLIVDSAVESAVTGHYHGLVPWCSCPVHRESSERLSPIVNPKVRIIITHPIVAIPCAPLPLHTLCAYHRSSYHCM